ASNWSIVDRVDKVFRKRSLFLISHDSYCCSGTIRVAAWLAEARAPKARDRRQFVPPGASPARGRIARDALEDGREMRLRAEAHGERDLGQRRLGIRQQRFRVFDALMEEIFARSISRRG